MEALHNRRMNPEIRVADLLKRPSAYLPLAASLAALTTIAIAVSADGAAHHTDEGSAAHIWQLLMFAQLLLIVFFAVAWLRKAPRSALPVLLLQIIAFGAAMLPVWILGL
jgi:hypothetical protein